MPLSFQVLVDQYRKNGVKEREKVGKCGNRIPGRKEVWQISQGRFRAKGEHEGICGETQKQEKDEHNPAPFCLHTHLGLGLLESNYDL